MANCEYSWCANEAEMEKTSIPRMCSNSGGVGGERFNPLFEYAPLCMCVCVFHQFTLRQPVSLLMSVVFSVSSLLSLSSSRSSSGCGVVGVNENRKGTTDIQVYKYIHSHKSTQRRGECVCSGVVVVVVNSMEPSVSSLMDHLNGVETRRRVVMMKRKEAETRLAFATEEQQQLEQQRALNEKLEVELKEELDHLLEQQRQVQLRLISGMDTIRQSEVEEALLIEHANTQVSKVDSLLTAWQGHSKELDDLRKAWDKDEAGIPLQQRIAHLDEEAARLSGEKERLEQTVRDTLKANAMRATWVAATAAEPTGPPVPAGEHITAIQLKEQVGLEHRELAKLQAHHARQLGALEREVTDLTGRSVELSQWLADTVGARDQVLVSIQQLQSSLRNGVCASCRTSS